MASNVDTSFPTDGDKVSKAAWREQQRVISTEISALQTKVNLPGRQAFGDGISRNEVQVMLDLALQRSYRLAYQTAFGIISL